MIARFTTTLHAKLAIYFASALRKLIFASKSVISFSKLNFISVVQESTSYLSRYQRNQGYDGHCQIVFPRLIVKYG